MKKNFVTGIAVGVLLTLAFFAGVTVHAQSGQLFYMAPASGTTTTNCGTPASGSTPPLCGVATGWYVWNGTAWVQLGTVTASGVMSFNGRTGAVVPAAGDYSYSQLSSPPTSVTAGTFSVTSATIK
jgi:hypothetical protein